MVASEIMLYSGWAVLELYGIFYSYSIWTKHVIVGLWNADTAGCR